MMECTYDGAQYARAEGPSWPEMLMGVRACVYLSVHWLCASDDQTGIMAWWRFGRLTGMIMQCLGVAIRWQIARYDHAKPRHGMARCCHGMVTCWYPGQPFSFLFLRFCRT